MTKQEEFIFEIGEKAGLDIARLYVESLLPEGSVARLKMKYVLDSLIEMANKKIEELKNEIREEISSNEDE